MTGPNTGDDQTRTPHGTTTGYRKTKDGVKLLVVFSTSWAPFEATTASRPKGYTPFEAYTLLNHNGDWSAAAKKLGEEGYGTQRGSERATWNGNHHDSTNSSGGQNHKQSEANGDRKPPPRIARFTAGNLITEFPRLNPPVVEGLIREGETCNIISLSKFGKTWLTYGLAFSIITGRPWLDRFATSQGRVLIIDNELHKPTIGSRLKTVADAMGVSLAEYADALEIWPLRGNLRDIFAIEQELRELKRGEFKAIILDAKYRMMPMDASENSNSDETRFYNQIDRYADMTGGHLWRSSREQGRSRRQAGNGCRGGHGAQSRAADCHLVLREHEEPEVAVLEAAVRSFAPVGPMAIRWSFPLWTPDEFVDATLLKGRATRRTAKGEQKEPENKTTQRDERRAAEDRADEEKVLRKLDYFAAEKEPATLTKLQHGMAYHGPELIAHWSGCGNKNLSGKCHPTSSRAMAQRKRQRFLRG